MPSPPTSVSRTRPPGHPAARSLRTVPLSALDECAETHRAAHVHGQRRIASAGLGGVRCACRSTPTSCAPSRSGSTKSTGAAELERGLPTGRVRPHQTFNIKAGGQLTNAANSSQSSSRTREGAGRRVSSRSRACRAASRTPQRRSSTRAGGTRHQPGAQAAGVNTIEVIDNVRSAANRSAAPPWCTCWSAATVKKTIRAALPTSGTMPYARPGRRRHPTLPAQRIGALIPALALPFSIFAPSR